MIILHQFKKIGNEVIIKYSFTGSGGTDVSVTRLFDTERQATEHYMSASKAYIIMCLDQMRTVAKAYRVWMPQLDYIGTSSLDPGSFLSRVIPIIYKLPKWSEAAPLSSELIFLSNRRKAIIAATSELLQLTKNLNENEHNEFPQHGKVA